MPADPSHDGGDLLRSVQLRSLAAPNLTGPLPLLAIDAEPGTAVASLSDEDWRALLETARRTTPAAVLRGVPESDWQAVGQAPAAGRLAALLRLLFRLLCRGLGDRGAAEILLPDGGPGGLARLVVVPRPPAEVGELAASLLSRLLRALQRRARSETGDGLEELWQLCDALALHPFLPYLAEAAQARGVAAERLPVTDRRLLRVGEGSRQHRFFGALPPDQSSLAMTAAQRRDFLLLLLAEAGLPVVPHRLLVPGRSPEDLEAGARYRLRRLLRTVGEPAPPPLAADEIEAARADLGGASQSLLIQRLPPGRPLRLLLAHGRCFVAGRDRRSSPDARPPDAPPPDASPPGPLPPAILLAAREAAQLLELAMMGLDLVVQPQEGEGPPAFALLDVDPAPEPTEELSSADCRRLAAALVAHALPTRRDGEIPTATILAAATATPEDAALTEDAAAALAAAGWRVGTARDGRAWVAGRLLPGPRPPAQRLRDDRGCDLALAVCTPPEVRAAGLPFPRSEVAFLGGGEPGWAGSDPAWLAAARLLASTAAALVLPVAARPELLQPPPAARLLAYAGEDAASPPWAQATIRPVREGDRRYLLLDCPAERPPQRLAVLPARADAGRGAALAALLLALQVPLEALRPAVAAAAGGEP